MNAQTPRLVQELQDRTHEPVGLRQSLYKRLLVNILLWALTRLILEFPFEIGPTYTFSNSRR